MGINRLVVVFTVVNWLIKVATDAGIIVVVAAGNDAINACDTSPASAPEAITVGSTELKNDSITSFSNFGPCVDIFAPGIYCCFCYYIYCIYIYIYIFLINFLH